MYDPFMSQLHVDWPFFNRSDTAVRVDLEGDSGKIHSALTALVTIAPLGRWEAVAPASSAHMINKHTSE